MLQANHFWHFATWEIGHMSQHVTGDLVAENYTNYATVPGEFSCRM